MRRNCNLQQIHGLPMLAAASSSSQSTDFRSHSIIMTDKLSGGSHEKNTVFYNEKTSFFDITELQARAIIWQAAREMEQKIKRQAGLDTTTFPSPQILELYGPPGVSMKRSLQQFLQRRRDRIHATSPYNH